MESMKYLKSYYPELVIKLGFCAVGVLPGRTLLCMGSLLLTSFDQLPWWAQLARRTREIDIFSYAALNYNSRRM